MSTLSFIVKCRLHSHTSNKNLRPLISWLTDYLRCQWQYSWQTLQAAWCWQNWERAAKQVLTNWQLPRTSLAMLPWQLHPTRTPWQPSLTHWHHTRANPTTLGRDICLPKAARLSNTQSPPSPVNAYIHKIRTTADTKRGPWVPICLVLKKSEQIIWMNSKLPDKTGYKAIWEFLLDTF